MAIEIATDLIVRTWWYGFLTGGCIGLFLGAFFGVMSVAHRLRPRADEGDHS